MKEFVKNTMGYLEQYHLRGNSEAGFAADNKDGALPRGGSTAFTAHSSASVYGITFSIWDIRE